MMAQKRSAGNKAAAGKATEQPFQPLPPLKPRPVLFVVLSILLALWLIALVVMRLRTVQPPPIVHTEPSPSASP